VKIKPVVIVILCLAVVGSLMLGLARKDPSETEGADPKLSIGNRLFELDVADTDAERIQGLSGRNNLGSNTAMLFVFPKASEQCMWMKDMKFSLDMVWLDESKRIAKIAEGVTPETYPQAFCAENTKYVLEFNAGVAKEAGLKIGQNLNF
jgi:uncharacterized membrane protein (UPF0127 family)